MNEHLPMITTRFPIGDLPSANCGKELDEQLKLHECIVAGQKQQMPHNGDTSVEGNDNIRNGNVSIANNDDDGTKLLAWYPAAEFLELESFKSYSFAVSAVCVDAVTTDGPKFTQIMDALTEQLQQHVTKANLLISINEKIPQFDAEVEELMRIAIGRTQLLLTKRVKQFREQLSRHLSPIPGQKITKLNDLHGLWALIDMQLDDIRSIFGTIEQFRLRSWTVADSVISDN